MEFLERYSTTRNLDMSFWGLHKNKVLVLQKIGADNTRQTWKMVVIGAQDQLQENLSWELNQIVVVLKLSITNKRHNLEILYIIHRPYNRHGNHSCGNSRHTFLRLGVYGVYMGDENPIFILSGQLSILFGGGEI